MSKGSLFKAGLQLTCLEAISHKKSLREDKPAEDLRREIRKTTGRASNQP